MLPALLVETPARFIRARHRAHVLSFFGAAFLVACALDIVLRRAGGPARAALVVVALVTIGFRFPLSPALLASTALPTTPLGHLERWGRLPPPRYLENPALGDDAPSYAALARVATARGGGPLLDLPVTEDGAAVVGQMVHRQPTVAFYTGYLPAHVSTVERLIAELPDRAALDDLVDMTGLRWIVVRSAPRWPSAGAHRDTLAALRAHPRVRRVDPVGTFTLVELDPTSRRPDWLHSVAAGPRRGFSALGAPLVRLPATARATVDVIAPPEIVAGHEVALRVAVSNAGPGTWPAAAPARPGVPLTVRIEVAWVTEPDGRRTGVLDAFELRRDVPPGETLEQRLVVTAPGAPGPHRLEVAVRQLDGAELSSPRNPLVAAVEVAPPTDVAAAR
jgi:hypothetical protein